ncbi:hypothetical protein NEUTE1DRAFT_127260 [Neurospora tetrasperma FGSC 2508]|uniref:Uncharacterized protein n=1 Tax=Neurospora tetrasperma (strain FGSC 2508 / ATCC MYA-4615 / P0657) TaxID=510951 RepID=F8MC16_NEUT8|nr:uncharacterized protein NEUTE1DRAFT_127260 [Neurospora tetrasperma FGSC 2508]EGO60370.1 hypothetical protein NEUTE1DRAFT_127260 [Neurospora tetrasperma FGSC 2508]
MLPSSSRRVVGRILTRATAAVQQQQREQQIRILSDDNPGARESAAITIICLIVIRNSSWWCSTALRMELLSARSHKTCVPDSIFRTQTKPECFGGNPTQNTRDSTEPEPDAFQKQTRSRDIGSDPNLDRISGSTIERSVAAFRANPGGKKEAHFWTTILGIMCHVSCSPPQLGTSARTSSRDQEFWVRDQCLRVLQFDKVQAISMMASLSRTSASRDWVKRWTWIRQYDVEKTENGGGIAVSISIDRFAGFNMSVPWIAVDLKTDDSGFHHPNPFGLGVGLALPRRGWIDITGRGIPRPCHPSKILRSNPAAPHLPSYCCATVSHKKRVRWSAKNPLLAEWNQAWLVGNAPQSRSGNKVETGEGEERKLWFLKKGFQLTLARDDYCCLSTMSCPQESPNLNERSQKQPKQAAQRGRSSDMG